MPDNTDDSGAEEISGVREVAGGNLASGGSETCPYCLAGIIGADDTASCPGCRATYHRECWQENGGCAVYGCSCVPAVESRASIEVPMSYWGQENKPCPACNQQILAAAVRCRHCGATFTSARPQDAGEFLHRNALAERLPAARQQVIIIFVLSVIPFTAPIGAVWGLLWCRDHEEEIAALPPFHVALSRIGLTASMVLTIAFALMTTLYVVVRG